MSSMSEALGPNQYATYEEYDRELAKHNRAAASILHQFAGADEAQREVGVDEQHKAHAWDHYAAMVRKWDAQRPEWVR